MALTEIGARLRLVGAPAFKKSADQSADGLSRLAREAGQADRKVSGLERAARRSRSALGGIAGAAGFGALGVAAAGIGALSVGLLQGFRDAQSLQTMLAKTNAVITSTSGAANVSAASVVKMSDSLEAMSMIDQEAILQGQNMLLTFTKVRNGVGQANQVFDQATQAMVDMSVAMGKDPQAAAIMLGKALQDPVKGVTALTKAGVSFDDQQKKQIKTLVASGRAMDAQKLILKELNVQFGGAAKAAGSGFEGALFRAKDALSDLFRDVSTPLLPGFTAKIEELSGYLTNTATPAILGFVKGFQNNSGAGGDFRKDLAKTWAAAKDVGGALQTAYEKTKQIVGFVRKYPDAFTAIAIGVGTYATAMKAAATYTALMAGINFAKIAAGIGTVGAASTAATGAAAASTGLLGLAAAVGAVIGYGAVALAAKAEASASNQASTRAGLPTATIGNSPTRNSDGSYTPVKPKVPITFTDPKTGKTTVTQPVNRNGDDNRQPRGGLQVVVPLVVNGRELGRAVIEDFETRGARR